MRKILIFIIGFIIGISIGITIMSMPEIRYDLNNDNEVSLVDVVVLLNYVKGRE